MQIRVAALGLVLDGRARRGRLSKDPTLAQHPMNPTGAVV